MKIKILLAMAALVVVGCSSVKTNIDEGPVRASTFAFINGGMPPNAEFTDNRDALHKAVQDSITRNLGSRGLTKVATGSDVIVAYLVIIGNNASTESIDKYFGYRNDTAKLEDKAQSAYVSNKNPNYFEAGTLLVDIVDAKTFKVLRRNYVTRPLLRNATAEVRAARIQEAVDEVLRGVKIAK